MKSLFFFLSIVAALPVFAQLPVSIKLKKDQLITVVSSSSMDADMGMGMQMKNNTSATNQLVVLSEDDKQYLLTNTLTKISMNMDAMGQQSGYDSEKPEDKNSEMGKSISNKLQVPDSVFIDKVTGNVITSVVKAAAKSPEEANPLEGMFESMGNGNDDQVLANAFFIIPAGKKAGDSWTDSIADKKMKSIKTYTIRSLDKNVATIAVTGVIDGNSEQEIQGNTVNIIMNTKMKGELMVDTKTGLVSKRTLTSDITGNLEMMGQSLPISSQVNATYTYQY